MFLGLITVLNDFPAIFTSILEIWLFLHHPKNYSFKFQKL